MAKAPGDKALVAREDFDALIEALGAGGRRVIGPTVRQATVVYDDIAGSGEMPVGLMDEQLPGHYRLKEAGNKRLFGYTMAPQSWKRQLWPPVQRLFAAERGGGGFRIIDDGTGAPERYAFLGVRACELAAIQVQDRTFDETFTDPGYVGRRREALIVGVTCSRACETCFCASMGTGPGFSGGFDLAMTELEDERGHRFLVEVGSERGAAVLAQVPTQPASPEDEQAAARQTQAVADSQGRRMDTDMARRLQHYAEHPRWEETAIRCFNCGNCTQVCPTCFCTTTEDSTDISGNRTERNRRWDSCYTIDFSYIHGGSVRQSGASRYRQWITHKLSTWHDQFGVSGCIGCGRCITWCPVGIDITEEVQVIRESEQKGGKGHGAG